MTRSKGGPRSSGADVVTDTDVRPLEDQFERARRQARELEETTDRYVELARQRDAGKAAYKVTRPRVDALRRMATETVGFRGPDSAATRRAALRRHPVYLSLPESERRAWDILVDEWTETILAGDLGTVWRGIAELADRQVAGETLGEWDPPAAERMDPAALAALIPRG